LIVVGFAPGGPADALARIAAQILSEGLTQTAIVENRPGAGGIIAASAVAKATPDGYTLLANAVSDVINPLTSKQAQYSIETSFTPIALIASAPNVLVVHPSVPVGSVKELIEYARSHPDS
jgi:tripartite-type tricarboxylate transporter receptor subunit TctC